MIGPVEKLLFDDVIILTRIVFFLQKAVDNK